MKKVRQVVLAGVFASILVGSIAAAAGALTIDSPIEGDTVVNTNARFSGTAEANTLVKITIVDTDEARTNIAHQPNGRVEGNVTSDKDGEWVFVPQDKLTPGQFTIQAAYANSNSQVIHFMVVDDKGNSAIPSSNLKLRIALIVLGVIVVVGGVGFYIYVRKKGWSLSGGMVTISKVGSNMFNRSSPKSLFAQTDEGQKLVKEETGRIKELDGEAAKIEHDLVIVAKELDGEAAKFEHDLVIVAKELEATNKEVVTLREKLAANDSPVQDEETSGEKLKKPHSR